MDEVAGERWHESPPARSVDRTHDEALRQREMWIAAIADHLRDRRDVGVRAEDARSLDGGAAGGGKRSEAPTHPCHGTVRERPRLVLDGAADASERVERLDDEEGVASRRDVQPLEHAGW